MCEQSSMLPPGSPAHLSPVHDALPVQMLEAAADLGRVEGDPFVVETRVAHVVDVELQVAAVHDGEDQAEGVLGFVGVG